MSSPKLFLEINDIDGKFKVIDKNGFAFGDGYEPTDAIKHARIVTDNPISIGEICGLETVCFKDTPHDAIADHDVFISALAELAGMQVIRVFNDDMHFVGYTMEAL